MVARGEAVLNGSKNSRWMAAASQQWAETMQRVDQLNTSPPAAEIEDELNARVDAARKDADGEGDKLEANSLPRAGVS
jgi:hypothetical protein